MTPSRHVRVVVDLARVRANCQRLVEQTGVPVIAVVKADAYGLGAERVTAAIADLVDSFCLFQPDEAAAIDLWNRTGKQAIAIGPPLWENASDYLAAHVRPAVSTVGQAETLRDAKPLLCVDTGQQRFACPSEQVPEVLAVGGIQEAFTHAANLGQVRELVRIAGGKVARLHAAGSSLLDQPEARLDAVRPGLALYRGAVRITTPVVETRKGRGPVGYTGFITPFHGVILAGYSNGLRPGPCSINGRRSRIIEVGMQSAFVETAENDRVGDKVELLGDTISEQDWATAWKVNPHEVLVRMTATGIRSHAM
jgi:alanine racemase